MHWPHRWRKLMDRRVIKEAIVITGLSGTGKTTLARELANEPEFYAVQSFTTRPKRDYEVDGHDYVFLSDQEFQAKLEAGEFIESAPHDGYQYATKLGLFNSLSGIIPVFVLNDEGAEEIASITERVWVFKLIVDADERLERLVKRGDTVEAVKRRQAWERDNERAVKALNQIELVHPPNATKAVVNNIMLITGRRKLMTHPTYIGQLSVSPGELSREVWVTDATDELRRQIGALIDDLEERVIRRG